MVPPHWPRDDAADHPACRWRASPLQEEPQDSQHVSSEPAGEQVWQKWEDVPCSSIAMRKKMSLPECLKWQLRPIPCSNGWMCCLTMISFLRRSKQTWRGGIREHWAAVVTPPLSR